MYNIKTELEDLSLKYTEPLRFDAIKNKIEGGQEEQKKYIKDFSAFIEKSLNGERLKYFIKGKE